MQSSSLSQRMRAALRAILRACCSWVLTGCAGVGSALTAFAFLDARTFLCFGSNRLEVGEEWRNLWVEVDLTVVLWKTFYLPV